MNKPEKRVMPKGGRKGGATFPRMVLKDAVGYAKKLVSKSHTAPIPRDVLFSGVLGAKSGAGNVKASAVKQYGLMVGDQKSGYSASELAKKITTALPEELPLLLRQAALSPLIFKSIFDTFHGDAVPRGKIRQRAADLNVHPDQAEDCADIYLKTMIFAGLVTMDGDKTVHVASSSLAAKSSADEHSEDADYRGAEGVGGSDAESLEDDAVDNEGRGGPDEDDERAGKVAPRRPVLPKAIININVSLDSTTDSDKLAKQLALLRKYGAI
jgi:hypothetical protein